MTNYDLIVVGGGCGGLTAAACAAKEGKKVLLLEKNDTVGGALSSFTRGRFEFDVGVRSILGATHNNGDVKRIFDFLGISQRIHWVDLSESYRIITRSVDGKTVDAVLPFGENAFIAALEKYVPGSRRSVERLFALFKDVYDGFSFIENLDGALDTKSFKLLKKSHGNFVRTASYSVDEVFEKLLIPQKARDILNALWMYYCVDTSELQFSQYALFMYTFIVQGAQIPKNGSYEIAVALCEAIEENGGEIRCCTPVDRILFENNKANAVLLKNGEKLFGNNIICNCSPYTAYSKMIKRKNIVDDEIKRVNASSFGARAACVYIGLNRSPEELGIKDYSVYITETSDTKKQSKLMRAIDSNNTLIAVCPNAGISGKSAPGTCILTLTTFYTDNSWGNVEAETYFDKKEALAAKLISLYENATGNVIRNNIEELEVATPLTFSRYLSTPQGSVLGFSSESYNSLLSRLSTEKSDFNGNGPVFCGGTGTLLSGVHSSIASGRNAFYATSCKQLTKSTENSEEDENER